MTLRPLDCQRGEFIEESDSGRGSIAAIEQCDSGFLGQTHNDAVHRCIQKSIARFHQGRQYFKSGFHLQAKLKFNRAVKLLIQASNAIACPVGCNECDRENICLEDIVNFIKERSSSIVAFYQQNSRVGHGLDSELVQDVAGKFTTEETCRMLDGLLVIFLTCLSYAHQALGEEVEALLLHSARIELQKLLFGTPPGLHYTMSASDLPSCQCGCVSNSCLDCCSPVRGIDVQEKMSPYPPPAESSCSSLDVAEDLSSSPRLSEVDAGSWSGSPMCIF